LETTSGGSIIDGWDEVNKDYLWRGAPGTGPFASDLWRGVSSEYAKGATGEVNVIQTPAKLWDPTTIWHGKEKGALMDLQQVGQVDDINIHVLNSQLDPIQLPSGYVEDVLNFDPPLPFP
jgi:hypothetical protein